MEEKKVCIVGFASTSRGQVPWAEPGWEFWGCNEGYVQEFPVIDRWFQIHPFISFSRADNPSDPKHFEWLKERHPFEIYMQKWFPFVPSSVQYPLEEYQILYGRKYFRSSFDYMMAMAIAEGYKEIGVFGFEMASGTEYAHQRPSAEYWIGIAEGMGIKIREPENWNLLRGSLYGFEDNSVGFRQQLEIRLAILKNQLQLQNNIFNSLHGASKELDEIRKYAIEHPTEPMDIGKKFQERQEEMVKQNNLLQVYQGAKMEVENMINIFDGHSGTKAAEKVIEKPEEDNAKKE